MAKKKGSKKGGKGGGPGSGNGKLGGVPNRTTIRDLPAEIIRNTTDEVVNSHDADAEARARAQDDLLHTQATQAAGAGGQLFNLFANMMAPAPAAQPQPQPQPPPPRPPQPQPQPGPARATANLPVAGPPAPLYDSDSGDDLPALVPITAAGNRAPARLPPGAPRPQPIPPPIPAQLRPPQPTPALSIPATPVPAPVVQPQLTTSSSPSTSLPPPFPPVRRAPPNGVTQASDSEDSGSASDNAMPSLVSVRPPPLRQPTTAQTPVRGASDTSRPTATHPPLPRSEPSMERGPSQSEDEGMPPLVTAPSSAHAAPPRTAVLPSSYSSRPTPASAPRNNTRPATNGGDTNPRNTNANDDFDGMPPLQPGSDENDDSDQESSDGPPAMNPPSDELENSGGSDSDVMPSLQSGEQVRNPAPCPPASASVYEGASDDNMPPLVGMQSTARTAQLPAPTPAPTNGRPSASAPPPRANSGSGLGGLRGMFNRPRPSASTSTPVASTASTSAPRRTTPATAPASATTSRAAPTSSARNGTGNVDGTGRKAAVSSEDDDDMPPLQTGSDADDSEDSDSDGLPKPADIDSDGGRGNGKGKGNRDGTDDEDMPPLVSLSASSTAKNSKTTSNTSIDRGSDASKGNSGGGETAKGGSGGRGGRKRADAPEGDTKASESDSEDAPDLVPGPVASSSTTSSAMPSVISALVAPPSPVAPSTSATPAQATSSRSPPPEDDIDARWTGDGPPPSMKAWAADFSSGLLKALGVRESDEEGDDDDEEGGDEDCSTDESAEGYDEVSDEDPTEDSDEGADSDDERIFPDGLPADPLLPLLFASRPFLHAARIKLYRRVILTSPHQASLLLRSLQAPTHAARDAQEADETGPYAHKNVLPWLVRELVVGRMGTDDFQTGVKADMSMGRGGAGVIIDIVSLCKDLQKLDIMSGFTKSTTKPFLQALKGLSKLTEASLTSGLSSDKPFLLTTPRVFDLLQHHWLEMRKLCLFGLMGADEGPSAEENRMWDLDYDLSNGDDGSGDESEEDSDEDSNGMSLAMWKIQTGKDVKEKPKGLTSLELYDPDVHFNELSLLLRDSGDTLTHFMISRPTISLTRIGLASALLVFGVNLTSLVLEVDSAWHIVPKPHTPVTQLRPKDQTPGRPSKECLEALAASPHFLDYAVLHLPNLQRLTWRGPLASTSVFAAFPKGLAFVKFGHCPDVKPAGLAKLLSKQVNRSCRIKNADGTMTTKPIKTNLARGLQCLTVFHDDVTWKDVEYEQLVSITRARGMCLHTSSSSVDGFGAPWLFPPMFMGGVVPGDVGPNLPGPGLGGVLT